MYNLGKEISNIGNIRETFFLNQTRVEQEVITSPISDFQIADYTFEVGGKNKKQKATARNRERLRCKGQYRTRIHECNPFVAVRAQLLNPLI